MSRQFCHLRAELLDGDRLPSISFASYGVIRQYVPRPRPQPSCDIFISRDLTTVDIKAIQRTRIGNRVVRIPGNILRSYSSPRAWSYPALLTASAR